MDGVVDLAGVRFGATTIDTGAQPCERAQVVGTLVRPPVLDLVPSRERRPDVHWIVVDAGEAARRDRDDRVCPLPEPKGLPDDVERAAEALLPQRVADDDGVVVGRPARARQHAEPRREAEHVEVGWTERNRLETAGVGASARADALFLERRNRLDLGGFAASRS